MSKDRVWLSKEEMRGEGLFAVAMKAQPEAVAALLKRRGLKEGEQVTRELRRKVLKDLRRLKRGRPLNACGAGKCE